MRQRYQLQTTVIQLKSDYKRNWISRAWYALPTEPPFYAHPTRKFVANTSHRVDHVAFPTFSPFRNENIRCKKLPLASELRSRLTEDGDEEVGEKIPLVCCGNNEKVLLMFIM